MAVGPRNQQNPRPAPHCGFGESISHASAGAVGQITHGINFFPRGPGGNQHCFSGQILRCA